MQKRTKLLFNKIQPGGTNVWLYETMTAKHAWLFRQGKRFWNWRKLFDAMRWHVVAFFEATVGHNPPSGLFLNN